MKKETLNELEDKSIEIIQWRTEMIMFFVLNEQNLKDMCDNLKRAIVYVIGFLEGKENDTVAEKNIWRNND